MDLGDGYSLEHISDGWYHARRRYPRLPTGCPAIGFSCFYSEGHPKDDAYWLAVAAFFPGERFGGQQWTVAEYLTFTNDRNVRLRTKSEAFKRCVPFMLALAESHGFQLLIPSSSKGVTAILRNMGVAYSSGLDLLVGP